MKPVYKRASYTGDFLELKNENISLRIFKRLCGWGFGEVWSADGRLMAVLDHFGEILLRDQEIPMRLEAEDYESFSDGDRSGFVFKVRTTLPAEKLRGTSFEKWVHFPFNEPVLSGTVKICLRKGDTGFGISTELVSNGNYYARYLRLLWLLCGEGSFGSEKCDALLPGVDWPVGREWSGGTDFFKDPWAGRSIPHPNKVASSYMGVSCGDLSHGKNLARFLKKIKGSPLEGTLGMMVLRSMKRAVYSAEKIGHFGLAKKHYAHFTSPIRRYPDLVLHRQLASWIGGKGGRLDLAWLARTAANATEREQVADEAERTLEEIKKYRYLEHLLAQPDRGGEANSFDAVVGKCARYGLFVDVPALALGGMVHVSKLSRSYVSWNGCDETLSGGGRTWSVGDKIRVRAASVDFDRRQIDFVPD